MPPSRFVVNPETGKKIKVGGEVFNSLSAEQQRKAMAGVSTKSSSAKKSTKTKANPQLVSILRKSGKAPQRKKGVVLRETEEIEFIEPNPPSDKPRPKRLSQTTGKATKKSGRAKKASGKRGRPKALKDIESAKTPRQVREEKQAIQSCPSFLDQAETEPTLYYVVRNMDGSVNIPEIYSFLATGYVDALIGAIGYMRDPADPIKVVSQVEEYITNSTSLNLGEFSIADPVTGSKLCKHLLGKMMSPDFRYSSVSGGEMQGMVVIGTKDNANFMEYLMQISDLRELMGVRPATQRPGTQKPTTERPATQKPATQRPGTQRVPTMRPIKEPGFFDNWFNWKPTQESAPEAPERFPSEAYLFGRGGFDEPTSVSQMWV